MPRASAEHPGVPCRWCGAPVRFKRTAKGWVHTRPLAAFKLSRREQQDILADPPRPRQELHRQSFIHPAEPE